MTEALVLTETTTPAEAVTILEQRRDDREWGAKVLSGDADTRREYDKLHELASKHDRIAAAIQGDVPEGKVSLPGEPNLHVIAGLAPALREMGVRDAAIRELLDGKPYDPKEFDAVEEFRRQREGDAEWVKRYMAGGYAEKREMALMNIVRVLGRGRE